MHHGATELVLSPSGMDGLSLPDWPRLRMILRRALTNLRVGAFAVTDHSANTEAGNFSVTEDVALRFKQLMLPELDAAYNFARYLAKNPDVAQDIVQDAYIKALKGFELYRGGSPRAWIFAIIRNCFYDWQKHHRQKLNMEVDLQSDGQEEDVIASIASPDDSPETTLLRKTQSQSAQKVLASLSQPLREILVLREIEDLSYREVAETLALPIGTVMSRLARARKEFAGSWARHCALENKS